MQNEGYAPAIENCYCTAHRFGIIVGIGHQA